MKSGGTINITDPALRIGEVETVVTVKQTSDIVEPEVKISNMTENFIDSFCPYTEVRKDIDFNKINRVTILLPKNSTPEIFDKAASKLYEEISKPSIGSNSLLSNLNPETSTNL